MVKKPRHYHWHIFDREANTRVNHGDQPKEFESVSKSVRFLSDRNPLISIEHVTRQGDDYVVGRYKIEQCSVNHAPAGGWVLVKVTQNETGLIVHEVFGPYLTAKDASEVMDLQPKHAAVYYISTLRKL